MMATEMTSAALKREDSELVALSRAGDRGAFEQIVERYQHLICSLTYSATGSIGRSEDLAQETFVAAWKQLGSLREPERLRSWLCGITRNLINNAVRCDTREPAHHAESLEIVEAQPSAELQPSEKAITREEEAIVWSALERVPDSYREPLVLFYRENASVAAIATELELSEDAVKQRLSRGRDMLRREVEQVIEGALKRTRPGRVFTLTVLAALPAVVATSAKAAALGAVGKAAVPAAKGLLAAGGVMAFLGPLLGMAGAGFGGWASWQNARYQSQRDLIRRALIFYFGTALVFTAGTIALRLVRHEWLARHPLTFGIGLAVWIVGYIALVLAYSGWFAVQVRRATARAVVAGTTPLPETPWFRKMNRFSSRWEGRQWQSRTKLIGLPLIDIQFGCPNGESLVNRVSFSACLSPKRVARGWIAIGDRAHGLLFAWGNIAIGGIAIGGVAAGGIAIGGLAVGLLSIAGLGLGIVSVGGFAIGGLAWGGGALGGVAFGGLAIGWLAFGGAAFGWKAAQGGVALAHELAVGGKAVAAHANDEMARQFIRNSAFFQNADWQMKHLMPLMQGPWFTLSIVSVSLLVPALMLFVGYKRRPISK